MNATGSTLALSGFRKRPVSSWGLAGHLPEGASRRIHGHSLVEISKWTD